MLMGLWALIRSIVFKTLWGMNVFFQHKIHAPVPQVNKYKNLGFRSKVNTVVVTSMPKISETSKSL